MIPKQNKREFDDEFSLEARAPRAFKPAQIRQAAHVGHKVAHAAKSGIETASTIKSMVPGQGKREFVDEFDLEAREPGAFKPAQIRHAAHVGHQVAHAAKSGIETKLATELNRWSPDKANGRSTRI
ncbi:hypothetical protein CPB83DRAFT_857342 [Crepidotus variabilis]|uniref:Uncharacterized protein n=1 Tax=Crepidotus variabilis TaxID=179855 RepID=A0A9P6ECV9_9AGAR|nr:hypothetical protein CPB83DRAFT_857342 [Crepidotus variabilis]